MKSLRGMNTIFRAILNDSCFAIQNFRNAALVTNKGVEIREPGKIFDPRKVSDPLISPLKLLCYDQFKLFTFRPGKVYYNAIPNM